MKVKNNQNIETNIKNSTSFTIQANRKAFEILSSQIYTYKERAIIRELVCNAYDSHLMAKTSLPIQIKIDQNTQTLSIIDHGIGMTQKQMEKLYTTYFDSNKNDTNDFIGGLGLGSKSPFCYTDSFSVISKCKGKLTEYLCFIGETGPQLVLQNQENCLDSGFEVIIPLKTEDMRKFIEEAKVFISECIDKANIELWVDSKKIDDITPAYKKFITDNFYSDHRSSYGTFTVRMGIVRYSVEKKVLDELATESYITYIMGGNMVDLPIGSLEIAASRETLSLDKKTKIKLVNFVRSEVLSLLNKAKKNLSIYKNDIIKARKAYELFHDSLSVYSFDFSLVGCKRNHYSSYTLDDIMEGKISRSVPKATRELNLIANTKLYRTRIPDFYSRYKIGEICYDMPEVKDARFVYIPKKVFESLPKEIHELFTEADQILANCQKDRLKSIMPEKRPNYDVYVGTTLRGVINFLREASIKTCDIRAKELKPGTTVIHIEDPFAVIRSYNTLCDCISLPDLLLPRSLYFTKLHKETILKRNPNIKIVEFSEFVEMMVKQSERNLEIIRIANLLEEKVNSRLKMTIKAVKDINPKIERFWSIYKKMSEFIQRNKAYRRIDYYGICNEIRKYISYEPVTKHTNIINFLNSTSLGMLKVFDLDVIWDRENHEYDPNPEQAEVVRYFVKLAMSTENSLQPKFYGYNNINNKEVI